MDKQSRWMVYPYNATLDSDKKEQTTDPRNLDRSLEHCMLTQKQLNLKSLSVTWLNL
jgi:hypothetical protein